MNQIVNTQMIIIIIIIIRKTQHNIPLDWQVKKSSSFFLSFVRSLALEMQSSHAQTDTFNQRLNDENQY